VSGPSFAELESALAADVGFRLFTVLAWLPERRVLRRVHTTHPREYPLGGEKTVEVDGGWLAALVDDREPWLGPDRAAVARVFADHELIASLGCGAVVNVPVVDGGRTLGVLNLLDAEGAYTDDSVTAALTLTGLAVQPLRRWHATQRAAGSDEARS
jgi:GAF domain-containing protein